MTKITTPDTADLLARTHQEPAAAPPSTELERIKAELHLMKTAGVIEVAIRNPSVSEYMEHWEGRATKAEARVADLEAALKDANRRAAMQGIYTDRQQCRAQRAEAALDEIIMEATSRNHAIDIARRARAEGGE